MEIDKFRTRISNAKQSSTEYRMSMIAARALLGEIDQLIHQSAVPSVVEPAPTITEVRIYTMDGGTL